MTAVDAGTPAVPALPVWRGIAIAIERSIRDGTHPVGARLPSELDIARANGVSRPTVVQAMRWLVARGLVSRRQGVGTFVAASSSPPSRPRVRLSSSGPATLRVVDESPARVVLAAAIGSREVASIEVDFVGAPSHDAEALLDWSVLVGDRGWSGRRRVSRTSVRITAEGVRLLVVTDVSDEFSERRCRIVACLDPAVFSVHVEQSVNWD